MASQGTCVSANSLAANTNIFGSGIHVHSKSLAVDIFLAFCPSFLQISDLLSSFSSCIISFLYVIYTMAYVTQTLLKIFPPFTLSFRLSFASRAYEISVCFYVHVCAVLPISICTRAPFCCSPK